MINAQYTTVTKLYSNSSLPGYFTITGIMVVCVRSGMRFIAPAPVMFANFFTFIQHFLYSSADKPDNHIQ